MVLAVIAAFLFDIRHLGDRRRGSQRLDPVTEIQNILLGLDGRPVSDPKGLFQIVPPAGWRVVRPPECDPYNLSLHSPNGAEISLMASRVSYNTLPPLFAAIEKQEAQYGIRTQLDTFFFEGRPTIRRTGHLSQVRMLALDFVQDNVAHHILCTTPPALFDLYVPALMEVLKTYRPAAESPGGNAPE